MVPDPSFGDFTVILKSLGSRMLHVADLEKNVDPPLLLVQIGSLSIWCSRHWSLWAAFLQLEHDVPHTLAIIAESVGDHVLRLRSLGVQGRPIIPIPVARGFHLFKQVDRTFTARMPDSTVEPAKAHLLLAVRHELLMDASDLEVLRRRFLPTGVDLGGDLHLCIRSLARAHVRPSTEEITCELGLAVFDGGHLLLLLHTALFEFLGPLIEVHRIPLIVLVQLLSNRLGFTNLGAIFIHLLIHHLLHFHDICLTAHFLIVKLGDISSDVIEGARISRKERINLPYVGEESLEGSASIRGTDPVVVLV